MKRAIFDPATGDVLFLIDDDDDGARFTEGTDLEARPAQPDDIPPERVFLTAESVLALYTIAERSAARRMINARFPTGHALAGQLIDPDANVQVLLDALIARRELIALDDTYFVQGIALLLGVGILTPERAARVAAGLPPE